LKFIYLTAFSRFNTELMRPLIINSFISFILGNRGKLLLTEQFNMNIKNLMAGLSVAAIALMTVPSAWSASQSVTAHIAFDTPLNVSVNQNLDFGTVTAGVASTTYRVSTAAVISNVSGPGAPLYGTIKAGNVTISGSTTNSVNIAVSSSAAGTNGSTVGNFTCDYNSGGSGSCTIATGAAPAGGKTLLIGADVTAPNIAAGLTDAPSLTVTVNYN
jgi:hypothetical protein